MINDLDTEDFSLTILLASSSASLDRSSKKNWVENTGSGLPPYVRKIARGVEKSGRPLSQAIAIAIGRIKKWAAGGDGVDADTQAKAAAALKSWNALKAKNKSKKVVKASHVDGGFYLALAASDFNGSFEVERVTRAWNSLQSAAREAYYEARRDKSVGGETSYEVAKPPYLYIRSLWTDFIIVEHEQPGGPLLLKIPYTVTDTAVDFGQPVAVKQSFEEVALSNTEDEWSETVRFSAEGADGALTPNEIHLLKAED